MKRCPFCAEDIPANSTVCPFCGEDLPIVAGQPPIAEQPPSAASAPDGFAVGNQPPTAASAPDGFAVGNQPPSAASAPDGFAVGNQPPIRKPSGGKGKYLKWGGLALLVIAIVAALIIFIPKLLKGSQEDTLAFKTYAKEVSSLTPDGAAASMELSIDIPTGSSETETNIANGIREIIRQSTFAKEIGMTADGPLESIADSYAEFWLKGIEAGNLDAYTYHLTIQHGYQTAEGITLHVADGVFGNGGPHERNMVVRLSDGHLMDEKELVNITFEDLRRLLLSCAIDKEKKETIGMMEPEEYSFAPDTLGCKVTFLVGSHFYYDQIVPVEAIAPYLTEEGQRFFITGTEETGDTSGEASSGDIISMPDAEPGRGDLGIFDLRGPVKECKIGKRRLTFNEDGQWTGESGKSLKSIYSGGVKRDKNGRLYKGMFDPYDETGHDYTLNSQGLVTEINYRDYMDAGTGVKYTYDADGYVATETVMEWGVDAYDEETGEGPKPVVSRYTILEKDYYGNWVKRKNQKGRIDTRTITYY